MWIDDETIKEFLMKITRGYVMHTQKSKFPGFDINTYLVENFSQKNPENLEDIIEILMHLKE